MARPPEQRFDAQDDHGRLGYAGGRFVLGLLGHQREFFVRYLPCRYAVAYERASDSRRPALYGCGCHARPRTPGQALDHTRRSQAAAALYRLWPAVQPVLLSFGRAPDERRNRDGAPVPAARYHHGLHLRDRSPHAAYSRSHRHWPGSGWNLFNRHRRRPHQPEYLAAWPGSRSYVCGQRRVYGGNSRQDPARIRQPHRHGFGNAHGGRGLVRLRAALGAYAGARRCRHRGARGVRGYRLVFCLHALYAGR